MCGSRLAVASALLVSLLGASAAEPATQWTLRVKFNRTPVNDGPKTIGYLAKGITIKAASRQGDWFAVQVTVGGRSPLGLEAVAIDDHAGNVQARVSGGVQRQERVVDRAQPGAGHDHDRQGRHLREVDHPEVVADRARLRDRPRVDPQQRVDAGHPRHAGRPQRRIQPAAQPDEGRL